MINQQEAVQCAEQLLHEEARRSGARRNRWAEFLVGDLHFQELAPYTPIERLKIVRMARARADRQWPVIAVWMVFIAALVFLPRVLSSAYLDWQANALICGLGGLMGGWVRKRQLHRAVIAVCEETRPR